MGHTASLAAWPDPALTVTATTHAYADPARLGARAGSAFVADERRVEVDLGPGARLSIEVDEPLPWPRPRFGGSSAFHSVPALNQYWHPWLLGGGCVARPRSATRRGSSTAPRSGGEKNWGRGFPTRGGGGQAQGFEDRGACVAFAGGQVSAGPLRTEVTALVVRLPNGRVPRLGNPGTSPVRAQVLDEAWTLRGRSRQWQVDVEGSAPLADAHVLPVPLPSLGRNTAGAIEHLGGALSVVVRSGVGWSGAGVEPRGLGAWRARPRRGRAASARHTDRCRGEPPATSALSGREGAGDDLAPGVGPMRWCLRPPSRPRRPSAAAGRSTTSTGSRMRR